MVLLIGLCGQIEKKATISTRKSTHKPHPEQALGEGYIKRTIQKALQVQRIYRRIRKGMSKSNKSNQVSASNLRNKQYIYLKSKTKFPLQQFQGCVHSITMAHRRPYLLFPNYSTLNHVHSYHFPFNSTYLCFIVCTQVSEYLHKSEADVYEI